MELSYRKAGSQLLSGTKMLAYCIWRSIITHKAITMLIISVIVNVLLIVVHVNDRSMQENISYRLMKSEMSNDSLRHANVKYFTAEQCKLQ